MDMTLAENVKALRAKKKLTQQQLADQSGLSYNTIQRVETGSEPSFPTLQALARFFTTTIDRLMKVKS